MNNEVKKILYKENPKAYLQRTYDEGYTYLCDTSIGDIYFFIPIEECFYEGKNIFSDEMPAKELIRWIVDKQYKPLRVDENKCLFFNPKEESSCKTESKEVLFNEVVQGVFKDEDDTLVVDINKLASNIREKTNRSLDEEYRNMVLELYKTAKVVHMEKSASITPFNRLKKFLGMSYSITYYYNGKQLMEQAIEEAEEIIELKYKDYKNK